MKELLKSVHICQIYRKNIKVARFLWPTVYIAVVASPEWSSDFPVVGRYRSHLSTLYTRLRYGRKPQICSWNFNSACNNFSGDITISGFIGYFRLSIVDAMALEHFRRSLWSKTHTGLLLESRRSYFGNIY